MLQSVDLPMPLRPITAIASVPIEKRHALEDVRRAVEGVHVLELQERRVTHS